MELITDTVKLEQIMGMGDLIDVKKTTPHNSQECILLIMQMKGVVKTYKVLAHL